ncbi:CRISPR-associated helicase Cas3' [Alloscardovia venturai]|uniref:CRISPR-associated helicase Cas3 n=1 Tax=Alloscardovia venturai TaxID=1769421 RepID=A0ABW2Y3B8_9BIFI
MGNTQTLYTHLHNTAELAKSFESEFSSVAYIAGIMHDVGKSAEAFQKYLMSDNGKRGSVVHAKQGAFLIDDISEVTSNTLTKEILELTISKHHGDLPDCISGSSINGISTFFDDFSAENKAKVDYSYEEIKEKIGELDLQISDNFQAGNTDVDNFLQQLKEIKNPNSRFFFIGLFAKYVFSRLVDADRLDAGNFAEKKEYLPRELDWNVFLTRFEKSMDKFVRSHQQELPINNVRNNVFEQCAQASDRETGIYKLSVPTGGGKTLASLNFALRHALKHKKKHIIYVIPYLSITSQTSQVFRDVLDIRDGEDTLLEHYSSVSDDDLSGKEEQKRRLAAERWDSPIIVTTMVQFLETAMSSRGTKLRKFHNMADSVIIFDEIQALPTNTINLFNEVVSFLSNVLHSTIVLCSATQPLLEKTHRNNLLLSAHPDLVKLTSYDLKPFKRTKALVSSVEKSSEEFADFAFEKAQENGGCLVIVNLRSKACEIYQILERRNTNNDFELVHLSTSMCGKHRKDCLKQIQETLESRQHGPLICVSTQLIEAGVDLSFPCVIRAMAGLDSIMQAAGRCNRNGESAEPKSVYVFPMKDERGIDGLKDIAYGKEITDQLIREYPHEDLLSEHLLHEYYERFLERLQPSEASSVMDYPLCDSTDSIYAYNLLSFNKRDRCRYFNRMERKMKREYPHVCAQAFKTVSDNFHVIPRVQLNVVVPYGQSDVLLSELCEDHSPSQYKRLQKLQDYTVSLFDKEYQKLSANNAIYKVDDELDVYALSKDYYNEHYGVVMDAELSPIFM